MLQLPLKEYMCLQEYHAVSRARNPSRRNILSNGGIILGRGGLWTVHSDNLKKEDDEEELETKNWLRDESLKFEDGPRHSQILFLVFLWSAALVFGLDNSHSDNNRDMCREWIEFIGFLPFSSAEN